MWGCERRVIDSKNGSTRLTQIKGVHVSV